MSSKQTHSRRQFLRSSALAAGAALTTNCASSQPAARAAAASDTARPNFLFIMCDQLGIDAISAHGCADVHTPNIDRLIKRGVTFSHSYSTSPVCSPARSSMLTGRMPVETGVVANGGYIHDSVPNLGQWLGQSGYDTAYCGKWHLPGNYSTDIPGFRVLPAGDGQGDLVDSMVSRSCETYLKTRSQEKPFLLVSSLMQPHDICFWGIWFRDLVPKEMGFQGIDNLPELPPNHGFKLKEPKKLADNKESDWSEEQWQYYNHIYYRQTEMLDADIGRILDALDSSGQAESTVVVFTSDHGESRGRHARRGKWSPYDESARVPLVFSCPGKITEGLEDEEHLASGLDIFPTLCDFAGIDTPPMPHARSLRPLLEGRSTDWREFLVYETQIFGRTVRTPGYKYVEYEGDPQRMLFDVRADQWETNNLAGDGQYGDTIADLQSKLAEWNGQLTIVEPTISRRSQMKHGIIPKGSES